MKITIFPVKLMDASSNGKTDGNWVAQSSYSYNVAPNIKNESECIFQIACRLNIDFDSKGWIEYFYCIDYLIYELETKQPSVETLADLASAADEILEAHFISQKLINSPDGTKVWLKPDSDYVLTQVTKQLKAAYP